MPNLHGLVYTSLFSVNTDVICCTCVVFSQQDPPHRYVHRRAAVLGSTDQPCCIVLYTARWYRCTAVYMVGVHWVLFSCFFAKHSQMRAFRVRHTQHWLFGLPVPHICNISANSASACVVINKDVKLQNSCFVHQKTLVASHSSICAYICAVHGRWVHWVLLWLSQQAQPKCALVVKHIGLWLPLPMYRTAFLFDVDLYIVYVIKIMLFASCFTRTLVWHQKVSIYTNLGIINRCRRRGSQPTTRTAAISNSPHLGS